MTKIELVEFLEPFNDEIVILLISDSIENPRYKHATIKYKVARITKLQKIDEQMKELGIGENEGVLIIR